MSDFCEKGGEMELEMSPDLYHKMGIGCQKRADSPGSFESVKNVKKSKEIQT